MKGLRSALIGPSYSLATS